MRSKSTNWNQIGKLYQKIPLNESGISVSTNHLLDWEGSPALSRGHLFCLCCENKISGRVTRLKAPGWEKMVQNIIMLRRYA